MTRPEEEFLIKLIKTFKIEADDHINVISAGLLELEKSPDKETSNRIVETIFREVHSLKGAARAVGQREIELICRSLESIFSRVKRNEVELKQNMFDLLINSTNWLNQLCATLDNPLTIQEMDKVRDEVEKLTSRLGTLLAESSPPTGPAVVATEVRKAEAVPGSNNINTMPDQAIPEIIVQPAREKIKTAETVRIPIKKLDAVLRQSEELITVRLSMNERITEIQALVHNLEQWRKEWSRIAGHVRIRERELINAKAKKEELWQTKKSSAHSLQILDYLRWSDHLSKTLERDVVALYQSARQDHYLLGLMTDGLLDEVKKIMMLPFSSLLEAFPKIVRDLSRDREKLTDLVVEGADIEVDKRVLDEMKDPLIHLIRNSIDHGIEIPDIRQKNNKNPQGKLTISISHPDSSHVEILVGDDGAGIDAVKVRNTALQMGLITQEESDQLSEKQSLALIFRSGFTTMTKVTDISGRGLGMAILREKVENLGGALTVETNPGSGTAFRILIPLAFASFHGIYVRLGDELYVFPSALVEKVARVNREEVKTAANKETIRLDDQAIPIVRLSEFLQVVSINNDNAGPSEFLNLVVVSHAGKRIAFIVDEIIGGQEVLVKSLGKHLPRVEFISAVTLLGSGKIVPILNVYDLIRASGNQSATLVSSVSASKVISKKQSILVAEDSITSRTLLKNILEGAGYEVNTAVDGLDAFTQLRARRYDILVSDVDMPRMSGFDLIAKVRSDKKIADIPAILVSSLSSREDRERGIDVGANAYIVKSGFDQNNLLEAIRQLI